MIIETLEKRYQVAIDKIGYARLLNLPEQIKELLKNTKDLKTKTELLEEIAKNIQSKRFDLERQPRDGLPALMMADQKGTVMTRKDEIEMEIRNQAVRLYPSCVALFELPAMVYEQIVKDNETRKKPYRVSIERCSKVIQTMNFQTDHKDTSSPPRRLRGQKGCRDEII